MKKLAEHICKNKNKILIVSLVLVVISFIGMKLTKINYDILVYLPEEIETVKGQNILTDEFGMGAYTIVLAENLPSKDILALEEKFKNIEGVNKVVSIYDVLGTNIPMDFLPSEVAEKIHKENTDLLFVTFEESTSSLSTIEAIREMKEIASDSMHISGMSAMVLDTMDLSESEIAIYIVIAVALCLLVLELSLDSYLVPILLLLNIGISILFNLGSNILFGEISYITKALVAVLQLGVTTDFSIFLYHAYEGKKKRGLPNQEAMRDAIVETFTSVAGSSLTTIAGFLVLITMNLTLGRDLGLVMAKGVFLGVVCVLTVFPSLLLFFDKMVEKTKHKPLTLPFTHLNKFVIRHYKAIFSLFLLLLIPVYLANSKVDVYYKIDKSLPVTLDSIVANTELKEKFNIVSPEIILYNKDMKVEDVEDMVNKIENLEGIDFVLSFSKIESLGVTKEMLPSDLVSVFESGNYQMMLVNSLYEIASDELNEQVGLVNDVIREYDRDAILAGEGPLMKDLVTISDEDFRNVNTYSIVCILIIMFIVLKSFSLPIFLILAIEFAIFLNMSVSYFGGVVLPFVAPIVLGTIQLGATIDYAILMTTTYMKLRREEIEKRDAVLETMEYCSNSIFVSGMCFFAATFGVGIYSELEMVGALCALISRGAIISMVVVIMVLPSILLIFDKLILKTTYKKKGSKNMKKENLKRIATAMFVSILFLPNTVCALTKEETVYAKLNTDGSVKNVLVTEHLVNAEEKEVIKDYSDLENIINTHSSHTYERNENLLTWQSNGNSIFYQGTTDKELPIEMDISYKLDGENISLDELIGKSGHVTIEIQYKNLNKHLVKVNGKKETIYTPFTIVTGTTISNDENRNISVSNGKVVDNGRQSILVGISTPGLYESLDYSELKDLDTIKITMDTEKFELPSIYAMATPKLLDMEDLEIFDKLDSLSKSVGALQSSINKIESGSKDLLEGMKTLSSGSKELAKGAASIYENLEKIKAGTISVDAGISKMISTLEASKKQMATSTELQAITNYLQSINFTPQDQKDAMILGLYKQVTDTTTIDTLITSLKQLQSGTKSLVNGTTALTSGAATLNKETKKLVSGVKELKTGVSTLNKGIHTFNTSGIQKLSSTTNHLYNTSNKLEEVIKLGNQYETFAGNDKKVEGNTKFVLVVDGVKVPKEEKKTTNTEEKETFFTRVKNLFQ